MLHYYWVNCNGFEMKKLSETVLLIFVINQKEKNIAFYALLTIESTFELGYTIVTVNRSFISMFFTKRHHI